MADKSLDSIKYYIKLVGLIFLQLLLVFVTWFIFVGISAGVDDYGPGPIPTLGAFFTLISGFVFFLGVMIFNDDESHKSMARRYSWILVSVLLALLTGLVTLIAYPFASNQDLNVWSNAVHVMWPLAFFILHFGYRRASNFALCFFMVPIACASSFFINVLLSLFGLIAEFLFFLIPMVIYIISIASYGTFIVIAYNRKVGEEKFEIRKEKRYAMYESSYKGSRKKKDLGCRVLKQWMKDVFKHETLISLECAGNIVFNKKPTVKFNVKQKKIEITGHCTVVLNKFLVGITPSYDAESILEKEKRFLVGTAKGIFTTLAKDYPQYDEIWSDITCTLTHTVVEK